MPNDGVRVIIDRKLFETILNDAGTEYTMLLNRHCFTGNVSTVARVALAAQDHLGRYDAQLLAANVRQIAGAVATDRHGNPHEVYSFTGLELL